MKNKVLLVSTLLFFVIINTSYFWEGMLGSWNMLLFLVLIVSFVALLLAMVLQIGFLVAEKFQSKKRLLLIVFVAVVLILSFCKPGGLIDFERFEGKDLLVAGREGTANCYTSVKLKERNVFSQQIICFGFEKMTGTYSLAGDTVKFKYAKSKRGKKYYEFAVISRPGKEGKIFLGDLILYKSYADTTPNTLFITKNELLK